MLFNNLSEKSIKLKKDLLEKKVLTTSNGAIMLNIFM